MGGEITFDMLYSFGQKISQISTKHYQLIVCRFCFPAVCVVFAFCLQVENIQTFAKLH